MRKKTFFILGSIIFTLSMSSCSKKESLQHEVNKISLIGSTSVAPLAKELNDEFVKKFTDTKIEMQEVGSSAGINSVIDGTAHIGMSSRELKDSELSQGLECITIALDGIVIIVNKENPVSNLSKLEINKIFKGEITNWKEVGGDDSEIIVISREMGAGTRTSFEELLDLMTEEGFSLVEDSSPLIADGGGAIKSNVSAKKRAIGYISSGTIDESIKVVSVDGFFPTSETIKNGSYEVARPFIYVFKNKYKDYISPYIDYIFSEEGQNIVLENSYIPIK